MVIANGEFDGENQKDDDKNKKDDNENQDDEDMFDLDQELLNIIEWLKDITFENDDIVQPKYRIDSKWKWREGSQGMIVKAFDRANKGREVAIKAAGYCDERAYRHFENAFKFLSEFEHPNLIKVFDYHKAANHPILVTEFLPNNLKTKIENPNTKFELEDLIEIIDPIASAVDFIHTKKNEKGEPVIHRDLKPSNVMISENGTIKLSDFGCAGFSGRASSAKGTMQYRAPEGFEYREGAFSPQSDIYSMAVMACDILTKLNPFQSYEREKDILKAKEDPGYISKKLNELGIPDSLADILVDAMHPDISRRPQTAAEFVERLRNVAGKINEEKVKLAAELGFYDLCDNLKEVLEREQTGMYGTYSLEDIDDIYALLSNINDMAASHGFKRDKKYQSTMDFFDEKENSQIKIINNLLERAADLKKKAKGCLTEEVEKIIYEVGVLTHSWPGMADERFSKAQIGDGTYEGYLEREKNPSRIGDGTYVKHYETQYPRKEKDRKD